MYNNYYTKYSLIDDITFILMLFFRRWYMYTIDFFEDLAIWDRVKGASTTWIWSKSSICCWQKELPKAITCTNTLYLTTSNSTYKNFKNSMEFAVLNTEGFLLFWTFCYLKESFIKSTPLVCQYFLTRLSWKG